MCTDASNFVEKIFVRYIDLWMETHPADPERPEADFLAATGDKHRDVRLTFPDGTTIDFGPTIGVLLSPPNNIVQFPSPR